MNDKLKKVIDLANRLQESALECDDVLSVTIDGSSRNRINTGIHLWMIQHHDVEGLEFYRQDDDGDRWFNSRSYGVNIYGSVRGGVDQ